MSIPIASARASEQDESARMAQSGSLPKGLALLELLSGDDAPLGVTALARSMDMPKSGVHRLLRAGASVVSLDRAGKPPTGADFVECDVADEGSVEAAVKTVADRYGEIHMLLNNAGIGGVGPVASPESPGDMDQFRRIIGVNLIGAAQVAAHVAHRMIANRPSARPSTR